MAKITDKQRKFSQLYVENGGNCEQACRGAGYSEAYASKRAYQLLKLPQVRDEVNRLRNRANQEAEKSATDVINEYSRIAFTDRVDFLKADPLYEDRFMYKAPDELTDEQRAVVEHVSMTMQKHVIDGNEIWRQEYRYRLGDKSNALQQMGRHFGIFDDKLRLTTNSANQFKHLSSEQLLELKKTFANVMGGKVVSTIDNKTGAFIEHKN